MEDAPSDAADHNPRRTFRTPDENLQGGDTAVKPAPEPQNGPEETYVSLEEGPDIENGEMGGKAVWELEAKDGADLILGDHARLGTSR